MKILYITTIGGTMILFKSLIKELITEGNTIDIATNETYSKVPEYYKEWGCKVFDISTSRSPFNLGNIKAVSQIKRIVKENKYDIVHCHTPLAGMATRLACRKLRKKQGVKVIYTAHGFHFYKGAPKKNWFLYYPIERICSKWTDVLITINKEDFEFGTSKMKSKKIVFIPGVGIDASKYAEISIDRTKIRNEIGVPTDAFMVMSVGELNKNKNHETVIKALGMMNDNNVHYVIAGVGPLNNYLEDLAKKEKVNLHLLGFRNDINSLFKACDINIFPSIREGFGLGAIEGMASGRPTICARNRGTITFGKPGKNCLFFDSKDYIVLSKLISVILHNKDLAKRLSTGFEEDLDSFTTTSINKQIEQIYLSKE
ncbi:MAG: glycosyltransferase family 4 protein [Bacilli bacterium]|nr:glycosyltransferase family 4 protein [Bacilli bacterium]